MGRKRKRTRKRKPEREFYIPCDGCRALAVEAIEERGLKFRLEGASIFASGRDGLRVHRIFERNFEIFETMEAGSGKLVMLSG